MTLGIPSIIQGGMGVAVSSWHLAREVSQAGGLGVISGTAMDVVLARRLQEGDPDGHMRRALASFPDSAMAERILTRYFIEGGKDADEPYKPTPSPVVNPKIHSVELTVLANYCEVWLAKEGHDGKVGINLLEKIQMCTAPAVLGAMVAGVDVVIMGAGIPKEMPALLRAFAAGQPGFITTDVTNATHKYRVEIDPVAVLGQAITDTLVRPAFLAIVSGESLARFLLRDPDITPDGFVIESHVAGGHSGPPRGRMTLDDNGEPMYGPKDEAKLQAFRDFGLPFWLAGNAGGPEAYQAALAEGAQGVQVGTLFALSTDSGYSEAIRDTMLNELRDNTLVVKNDPLASPTGFPFKVVQLEGTLSNPDTREGLRPRLCDLSYLVEPYEMENGRVGYRCPAGPFDKFQEKGGNLPDATGRACLCNGLLANIGLGQTRKDGYKELPLVTMGSTLTTAHDLIARHPHGWTARDVMAYILELVAA